MELLTCLLVLTPKLFIHIKNGTLNFIQGSLFLAL